MIQFKRKTCGDLEPALHREWLETNGLGGFASSTIIGLNTRRYHGLLVAATKPPVGRLVLLSKLEKTLLIDLSAYPKTLALLARVSGSLDISDALDLSC
jgi:glycogen debranching enzyme